MAHEINISVVSPTEEITISGYPEGYVFHATSANSQFMVTEPRNDFSFLPSPGANAYSITSTSDNSADIINVGAQVNITLGTLPANPFAEELSGFKYSFPNFVDSGTSGLSFGDVVYLEEDLESGANVWGSKCVAVDTSDIYKGAFNALFLFIKHEGDTLHLLNKGYFDLEDTNLSHWTSGRTIYLNSSEKLDILPTGVPGSWVRSLGFCVPNKDNKKRIWFEADSTYIKIN